MASNAQLRKLVVESTDMVNFFDMSTNIQAQVDAYIAKINDIKTLSTDPEMNGNPWAASVEKNTAKLKMKLIGSNISLDAFDDLSIS